MVSEVFVVVGVSAFSPKTERKQVARKGVQSSNPTNKQKETPHTPETQGSFLCTEHRGQKATKHGTHGAHGKGG